MSSNHPEATAERKPDRAEKPERVERELVLNATRDGLEIALVEDRRLVEYHVERENSRFNVGDIHLGRVRKINPGLNAAFVDVGHEKDAFLHYTDLGPRFRTLYNFVQRGVKGSLRGAHLKGFRVEDELVKTGKMNQVLQKGQQVLVQVLKEPISSKGPRITSEISLPGRYIVMTPFNGSIGVSRRITASGERKRLLSLLESIAPPNWGVIARTAAEGVGVAELHEDVNRILAQWETIIGNLKGAKPRDVVFSETRKVNALIRDLLSRPFSRIVVNDGAVAEELRRTLEEGQAGSGKIVHHYTGKKPIFDALDVTKQIKGSFGETVSLRSGAYLVIQHTEALHVIDINSGPKIARRTDQDENALKVNLETAEEVARQLRLRDLGGIIIVDFIDMRNPDHKKQVYKAMKDHMKDDRAKHAILPLSKFGLMQITRQRVRPEVNIVTQEKCPSCGGTGKVESTVLLVDEIEHKLDYLMALAGRHEIHLHAHPFVAAYLRRGLWRSVRFGWFRRWRRWVRVHPDLALPITEYRFTDAAGEEIRTED
jgi:ribonuclease G